MSIIYEALKKVQEHIDTSVENGNPGKRKSVPPIRRPMRYLLFALILSFGLFIGNILINSYRVHLREKQGSGPAQIESPPKELLTAANQQLDAPKLDNQTPPTSIPEKTQEPLVLNGIFFSENEGYALINNQIVKEGDVIEDSIVKKISSDTVELEKAGSVIMLSTAKR